LPEQGIQAVAYEYFEGDTEKAKQILGLITWHSLLFCYNNYSLNIYTGDRIC
jgi:hypothetical protein